jgi:hypothetical protein
MADSAYHDLDSCHRPRQSAMANRAIMAGCGLSSEEDFELPIAVRPGIET